VIDLKGGARHTFTNTGTVAATIVEVFGKRPAAAAAARGDEVVVTPLLHASVQLEYGGKVIQVDPWSQADLTRAKPADLILVTDDPVHHLDPKAIGHLRKPGAPVVVPAASQAKFTDGIPLANGESKTLAGVAVEAIAAYDIKPGEPSHPKGKANGYVLTLGGKRIYFAGVTECVPEVRALRNIDIAFVPMNLPLERMMPAAAAECVNAFKPKAVYLYHYDQNYAAGKTDAAAIAASVQSFPRRHPWRWHRISRRTLVSEPEIASGNRGNRRAASSRRLFGFDAKASGYGRARHYARRFVCEITREQVACRLRPSG
jgi:L-ascorbate metabolism protein UlaG (beta-lactamase superfamily)